MITALNEYKINAAADARGLLIKAKRAVVVRPAPAEPHADAPFDDAARHICLAIYQLNEYLKHAEEDASC